MVGGVVVVDWVVVGTGCSVIGPVFTANEVASNEPVELGSGTFTVWLTNPSRDTRNRSGSSRSLATSGGALSTTLDPLSSSTVASAGLTVNETLTGRAARVTLSVTLGAAGSARVTEYRPMRKRSETICHVPASTPSKR